MFRTLLLSVFATMAVMVVAATYPASYYTIAPETSMTVGDVNGDGSVTSVDVTALYNYLLNGDMTYYSTSDLNGDGSVTSVDVTVVYNALLDGATGGSATKITMKDYQNVTSTTAPDHNWINVDNVNYGDVIYITLDGVEQNMYVLVRTGGKWALRDISGSS